MPGYNDNVFLNCPLNSTYKPLFYAMLFIGSALHRGARQFQVEASFGNVTKSLWAICLSWLKSFS